MLCIALLGTTSAFAQSGPGHPQTASPADSLTYDQYVGETISGHSLADGWRTDTLNGGYNKQVYWNPFLTLQDVDRFKKMNYGNERDPAGNAQFFLYVQGRRYTGTIRDTVISYFTKDTIVFEATCVNGMVQGKGTLTLLKTKQVIATANFENGEIVGECWNRDLKTQEEHRVTYVKGSERWTKFVISDKDGKVTATYEQSQ